MSALNEAKGDTRDEAKARLRARTEEATALGIFGAPSFRVDGEIFWGNDRLEAALVQRARFGGTTWSEIAATFRSGGKRRAGGTPPARSATVDAFGIGLSAVPGTRRV